MFTLLTSLFREEVCYFRQGQIQSRDTHKVGREYEDIYRGER